MGSGGRRDEVVGVGIDVCSVERIGEALERTPGLGTRLFTRRERTRLEQSGPDTTDVARVAAQMFAVKEAVMKSLGAGFAMVPFDSVEVDLEGPGVSLNGAATRRAEELGAGSFDVRIELLDGQDGAVAVAEVVARTR